MKQAHGKPLDEPQGVVDVGGESNEKMKEGSSEVHPEYDLERELLGEESLVMSIVTSKQ